MEYDEGYVLELLAVAPSGLSQAQFVARFQNDINQGWRVEVMEAARRYQNRETQLKHFRG